MAKADLLVDLRGVAGLAGLTPEKGGLRIGAMTRVVELAENAGVAKDYPSLKEAALSLATPQLRNVGTVGGNLCQRPRCWYYRDPDVVCRKKGGFNCYAFQGRNKYHAIFGGGACYIVFPSDLAPALISLGATATIGTVKGDRTVPLEAFYALPDVDVTRETVLGKGRIPEERLGPGPRGRPEGRLRQAQGARHLGLRPGLGGGHGRSSRTARLRAYRSSWAASLRSRGGRRRPRTSCAARPVTEALIRRAADAALWDATPLRENGYKADLVFAALKRAVLAVVRRGSRAEPDGGMT